MNEEYTFNKLKYPDANKWRDRSTIVDGRWPDGSVVRISDPEFKPLLDKQMYRIKTDKAYRDEFLSKIFPQKYNNG